jgi:hypothetical protein
MNIKRGMQFGSRKPEGKSLTNVPGPGTYVSKSTLERRGATPWKADSIKRNNQYKGGNGKGKGKGGPHVVQDKWSPGPGSYELPSTIAGSGSAPAFGNRPRAEGRESTAYMGKGFESTSSIVSPGPAIYDQRSASTPGPAYSLRPRVRDSYDAAIPGPGSYTPSVTHVKPSSPMTKFPRSGRENKVGTSMGIIGPGPAYLPRLKMMAESSGFSFSSSAAREYFAADFAGQGDEPGPGAFEVNYRSTQRLPTTFKGKPTPTKPANIPGPGTYQGDTPDKRIPVTIGERNSPDGDKYRNVPGPGAYDATWSAQKSKSPAHKIGGGGRTDFTATTADASPGPVYAPISVDKFRATGAKGCKLGVKLQEKEVSFSPGPAYDVGQKLNKSPAYSMGVRNEKVKNHGDISPGPKYRYGIEPVILGSPSFSMGTSLRPSLEDL